jgi:hypothetical protein
MKPNIGDLIEINCPSICKSLINKDIIQGIVVEVFDALNPDGSDGNYQIDIKTKQHIWVRYIPLIDGGSWKLIKRNKNAISY